MEFLNGVSLTQALEAGKFETGRTIYVAKQLCAALGAAHEIGIVHRDMKPDNVQLVQRGDDSDFVKVLDFGIAKVGGSTSKLTQAGQVFGTPHYMSPEQCAGTNVDQRTDIYAVGVMLYEMATGKVPFDADNLMGILTKHLYENPSPPHELPPPVDVTPALEAVILKCLSK
jgi:serine/threonine-protein kinase